MSERVDNRAEIAKLARLLGKQPDELDYLSAVPAAAVRELREQATEMLFSSGSGPLGRLAAASKLLPVGLVANLAERVMGPVISARVATLLDADRAVQMAEKLPTRFVADIAVELDPRRAPEIIAGIPPKQIADVTTELVRRGEYVTMGRFVGYLSPASIAAAVKAMNDEALLEIALVLENKQTFSDVLDLISDARLEAVIDGAAERGLWPEALEMIAVLTEDQSERVIEIAAGRDDEVLDTLIAAADAEQLWPLVLPLIGLMAPKSLKRFAELRPLQTAGVLERVVDCAAEREDLWEDLVPMISQLPPKCHSRVITHITAIGMAGRLGEMGHALSA